MARIAAALALASCAALVSPDTGLAQGVSIARDAETEDLIQEYAAPLFTAAGLPIGAVQILLIPDPSFNAFVADPTRMFINTGAIVDSETPNEIIGVLAHETAHLAQGDLAGLRQTIQETQAAALVASLLGVGAAVAGAAAGVEGLGQASAGIMHGSAHLAQRNILAYRRAQESAADRKAMEYLAATGQSGIGMLKTLKRLADQTLLSARGVDPYIQSHPMAADRVIALEQLAQESPFASMSDPPDLQRRHDLVRAKLVGFTMTPQQVGRRYPESDSSLPARYARAIASYRTGALDPALRRIDGLIESGPDNPYFWELKGQALLEGGRPREAVAPLRKAVSLAPRSGLLRILFGQALVAADEKGNVDEAIKNLTVGLQAAPDSPVGWRTLARAHALKGDIAMAELATAQGLFFNGEVNEAKTHAQRAQTKLKTGSPAWLRADDIVSYKPPVIR